MFWPEKRGGKRDSKDTERERSPSACVEHEMIKERARTWREVTEEENGFKVQKYVGWRTRTKADHKEKKDLGVLFLTPYSHLLYQW